MNNLILGSSGYLGSYLKDHINFLDDIDGYIINCIGKPDLEFCEDNSDISYVSNYEVVSDIIKNYPNSKIIHFSSYYVYDGENECVEDSNVTKEYKYCEHKLMSEKLVVENGGVVFRLGKLFGHSNLIKQNKLTEYIMTSDEVVLDDVMFNPTSLKQVLKVVEYELFNNNLNGIFNLSNDGNSSHYEYGEYIKKYFNINLEIKRIKKHKRKFHNYGKFLMSCDKIKKFVKLDTWEDDMQEYLEQMKCIV
tara:strand:- start:31348 stop:32094 length:747 start_codon:yes stop_codon:yes gene_type:complete